MATNGYARITAGVKLVDINSDKQTQTNFDENTTNVSIASSLALNASTGGRVSYIPIKGYNKISLNKLSNASGYVAKFRFVYSNNTTDPTFVNIPAFTWTDYYDIPSNAIYIQVVATSPSSTSGLAIQYSLLA